MWEYMFQISESLCTLSYIYIYICKYYILDSHVAPYGSCEVTGSTGPCIHMLIGTGGMQGCDVQTGIARATASSPVVSLSTSSCCRGISSTSENL